MFDRIESPDEFGLASKGRIALGRDADFAAVEMKGTTIQATTMYTKSRETALIYDGQPVVGQVSQTYVHGTLVYDHGRVVGNAGHGRILRSKQG